MPWPLISSHYFTYTALFSFVYLITVTYMFFTFHFTSLRTFRKSIQIQRISQKVTFSFPFFFWLNEHFSKEIERKLENPSFKNTKIVMKRNCITFNFFWNYNWEDIFIICSIYSVRNRQLRFTRILEFYAYFTHLNNERSFFSAED